MRVVDFLGDDAAIAQAARVSYGQGTKTVQDDAGLINYLMRHWHTTPFEMLEIKLHIKLPVFVARQWIRHRTASVNEYSARYSILDREFYIPEPDQLQYQSTTNKQGRSGQLPPSHAESVQERLEQVGNYAFQEYGIFVDDSEDGDNLTRELARTVLPMSTYTQWYWKTDLKNLFHFLRLRNDPHAQYEIRVYAELIEEQIVAQWVPLAYAAFVEYQREAMTFSGKETKMLTMMLDPKMIQAIKSLPDQEFTTHAKEFSKGEWREFITKLTQLQEKI